jgi:hypothetical protein
MAGYDFAAKLTIHAFDHLLVKGAVDQRAAHVGAYVRYSVVVVVDLRKRNRFPISSSEISVVCEVFL